MEVGKVYYSMREVTQMTGLPASTLRFWEKNFPQIDPRKDGHGNRYYSAEEVDVIKRIQYMRDQLQITRLVAIRAELEKGTRRTDMREHVSAILTKIRQELYDIRAQI
ncbi:MAG: MerR family transcriptional regulator [Paludibacteraceae bacterium]|nr:MerR family transcriptional regulator [Paludibacteraceae bacterium]